MLPEERDAAYLWDMVEAAKEVRDMMFDVSMSEFLENVHEYGQIDYEMLYQTAMNDIPELISAIEPLLPPLES